MLSMLSYGSVRRVNAVLLFSTFAIFVLQFARQFGPLAWPILIIPFAFVGDLLTQPLVTVHALQLSCIFLSVAVVSLILERTLIVDRVVLATAVFVSGAVYNFVAFMFNPPLAPTLMAFLLMAKHLSESHDRRPQAVAGMAVVTLAWFSGYGLTWIAKWVLAASVLGAQAVTTNVLTAASGSGYAAKEWASTLQFLQPSWTVLSVGAAHLLTLVTVSWAIAIAILAWRLVSRRLVKEDLVDFLMLQLPLLIPVAWVEVMRTASLEHVGFVYRNFLPLAIFPLLAVVMLLRRPPCRKVAPQPLRVYNIPLF